LNEDIPYKPRIRLPRQEISQALGKLEPKSFIDPLHQRAGLRPFVHELEIFDAGAVFVFAGGGTDKHDISNLA